jgi:hypothetical protein
MFMRWTWQGVRLYVLCLAVLSATARAQVPSAGGASSKTNARRGGAAGSQAESPADHCSDEGAAMPARSASQGSPPCCRRQAWQPTLTFNSTIFGAPRRRRSQSLCADFKPCGAPIPSGGGSGTGAGPAEAEANSAKLQVGFTRETTTKSTGGTVALKESDTADCATSQPQLEQTATANLLQAKANVEANAPRTSGHRRIWPGILPCSRRTTFRSSSSTA